MKLDWKQTYDTLFLRPALWDWIDLLWVDGVAEWLAAVVLRVAVQHIAVGTFAEGLGLVTYTAVLMGWGREGGQLVCTLHRR